MSEQSEPEAEAAPEEAGGVSNPSQVAAEEQPPSPGPTGAITEETVTPMEALAEEQAAPAEEASPEAEE